MMINFVAFLGAACIGSANAVRLDTELGVETFATAYPEYNFAELDVETQQVDILRANKTWIK